MLVILLMCVASCAALQQQQLVDGLLVQQRSAKLRAGTWTVVVHLSGTGYRHLDNAYLTLRRAAASIRNRICADTTQGLELGHWRIQRQLIEAYNLIADPPRSTWTSTVTRRRKRALLGFVGKASKFLFGTATEDEVQAIRTEIANSKNIAATVLHREQLMLSLINKTAQLTNENHRQLSIMADRINEIANQTWSTWHLLALMDRLLFYSETLTAFTGYERELHREREHVKDVARALEYGRLTEDLLPLNRLQDILEKVSQQGYETARPRWYYEVVNIELLFEDNGITAFRLKLPIFYDESHLLYTLHSFPTGLAGGKVGQVTVRPQLLLNTEEATIIEPGTCRGDNPVVCDGGPMHIADFPCERGLITGSAANKKHCIVHSISSNRSVTRIAEGQYVLFDNTNPEYEFMCARKPTESGVLPPLTLLLNIPRTCRLQTKFWRLDGAKSTLIIMNGTIPIENMSSLHLMDAHSSAPNATPYPRISVQKDTAANLLELQERINNLQDIMRQDSSIEDLHHAVTPAVSTATSVFVVLGVCLAIATAVWLFRHRTALRYVFGRAKPKIKPALPAEHVPAEVQMTALYPRLPTPAPERTVETDI